MSTIARANLPDGWAWVPLDSLADVLVSTVDKKTYDGETAVGLCNYTDVYYNDTVTEDIQFMQATASADQISRFTVTAGDVPITKDSEASNDIGRPSFVPRTLPGVVYGYHLATYRPFDVTVGPFIRYLFEATSTRGELELRTPGVTRVGLSRDTLRNLRVPYPGSRDARAIADYLDHETAEIDALIDDLAFLAALATERFNRQVDHLIWHEPKRLIPIRRLASMLPGFAFKSADFREVGRENQRVLRGINVSPGKLNWRDTVTVEPQIGSMQEHYRLAVGDIVIGLDRPYISSGLRMALVDDDSAGALLCQRVLRLRATSTPLTTKWVYRAINNWRFRAYLEPGFSGVSVPHISPEQIGQFEIPRPDPSQLPHAINAIQSLEYRLDVVTADLTRAIDLTKERRAALITAAVTGQIDVTAKNRPAAEQLEDDIKELS